MEISQAVKDFYKRQKELGYSSFVNKNNNRYYKLGTEDCIQKEFEFIWAKQEVIDIPKPDETQEEFDWDSL